ncbi:YceI family protein [Labilibacter marinus]|uniref:YceI family protein n=1 Tax=Labilibacter marinus TaxID=1477105 RepID=UPI000AB01B75|nr:YceI family protein [Labilibacter marinus]
MNTLKMMKTIKFLFAAVALLVATSTFAQSYQVDTKTSKIHWEGKKIGGAHDGHIKFKEGSFTVKDDVIKEGNFVIDMNSITNDDIESDEYRAKLIGHLKSDDFFGVDKYATAHLKVTSAGKFVEGVAVVKGDLTIKGTSHPIEFEVKKTGKVYETVLKVDRAKYDIRYGSKSFFDNLGDKVIDDIFTLTVSLSVQ